MPRNSQAAGVEISIKMEGVFDHPRLADLSGCRLQFPAGLEAIWQHRRIQGGENLESYLRAQLHQTAHAAIPFAVAAHREPSRLATFDALCDAFLSNHVARRASTAQGQAFIMAASKAFKRNELAVIHHDIRARRIAGHIAPVFGAATAALGLSSTDAARLFLFLSLRGLISAAVRLGVVGPLEGQEVQWRMSVLAESLLESAISRPIESGAQTAPILDVLQGTQDRLYSRLFQS
jgi:urease accessory protein